MIDQMIGSVQNLAAVRFGELRAGRVTEAMGLVDGCPGCVANTEPPKRALRVGTAWQCAYVCSDCDHKWTTEWAIPAQPCGATSSEDVVTTASFVPNLWDNEDGPSRGGGTPQPGPNPLPFTRTGRG